MENSHIHNFLYGDQPFDFNGSLRHSTLIAGLRECRNVTKRNLLTGELDLSIAHGDIGSWLGTIGYFTVLDQIGSCFKKLDSEDRVPDNNKIKQAIKEFGFDLINKDLNQLEALLALRNAFTHDFNLLNVPLNSKYIAQSQHRFTVTAEIENWVVRLPTEKWDGSIDAKDFSKVNNITYINLYRFGKLVETIYSRLCQSYKQNQVELRISEITLINKYTFVITNG